MALVGQKPVDGRHDDWISFPYEREGMEMNLNWALNRANVVPRADAFHNPRQQLLAERLNAKTDASSVQLQGVQAGGDFPLLEAGSKELPFEKYDTLEGVVQKFFSEPGRDLYVATGSVGSYRGATVGVRVITDNPALCLIAQNLLVPAPYIKYETIDSPLPPVVFYVTDKLQTIGAVQYQEGDGGSLSGATGILCGAAGACQAALMSAIEETAAALLLEHEGVVPLPASVLRKGAKTALLFNASTAQLGEAKSAGALYCAHGSVLCPDKGVSAMWGGAVVPPASAGPAQSRLSVVVEGLATVTMPTDNLANAPTKAFFLGSKASGELSQDQIKEELEALSVEADAAARFLEAVAASKMFVTAVPSVKAALDKLA
ncbi:hypothetical protein JKP88DRAFT_285621 [Tribonema minus]|uniref:Uncharacterized protein n=1 Tax=Tribonema minus TaxID=303371 RepID=A0A835ZKT9_9STRA|nr:hypothetical protein JKP88DRAFT_285621 [Tribonema minus]